ncbi:MULTISPECIES: hypothetical protein [Flavobacterium]|uniref:hypothetical protein n=1 Tax=Flavobacterium TaxID=237 RepID=UPI0025432BA3|nr:MULTISPECIES: hypothetical protein [Flavobacterium]
MEENVKSGEEIVNDFFNSIEEIKGVDANIAKMLATLYKEGKLTDINVKNELQKLREQDGNKD